MQFVITADNQLARLVGSVFKIYMQRYLYTVYMYIIVTVLLY